MLILDLRGISFHPVVVVGLGNDLLFNFIVGHYGTELLQLPRLKQIYLKKAVFLKYHKVTSSRPVYYSILNSFVQR